MLKKKEKIQWFGLGNPVFVSPYCNIFTLLGTSYFLIDSVLAVLNAAIFFFQILPPNVWSQEAARIKQPGMKIPKKNTRYSGVCFTPSLITRGWRPPRSCFFRHGGHRATAVRRVVVYQENHRKPQITHLQHTMKCGIWRRAVLSTVGHAPTTILADFAWWGTHAVQPLRPSHGYFGKVEIGSKIWKLPVEIFRAQLRSKCSENIWRNACVQVPSIWNFGFFLEKFGSFKMALNPLRTWSTWL